MQTQTQKNSCYFCNLNKDINIESKKQYNFDISKNYLIKGDNLDVLYSMQDTYKNKIKLIYIDPPYNTKTKRNYKDNFFNHENWLNFMYPRLILARDLLRDDGIIFVSIDDNEQAQLKILLDDIFDSNNFIAQIVWEKRLGSQNIVKYISTNHEYILIYRKNKKAENFNKLKINRTRKNYIYKDEKGFYVKNTLSLNKPNKKDCFVYPVLSSEGKGVYPPKSRGWLLKEETYKNLVKNNQIIYSGNTDRPMIKKYVSENFNDEGLFCTSIWDALKRVKAGYNAEATIHLKDFFDGETVTSFPKSLKLLKTILSLINTKDDDIILDFFAGSGSTGHAVIEKNLEDKINRKFILIQNDEKSMHKDYSTIFDVCNERLKRVYKKNNIEIDYEVL